MAKKIAPLLPSTEELLCQFGDRLHLARLRRRLSAKQVAERAGMSPMTLRSLERGGSGVTMGAYLSVMQVLGIEQDLNLLGKSDPLGRELQDSQLPGRTKINPSSPEKIRKLPVIPSVHLRESADPKTAQDWIEKSGFASAEALSGLIDPGASLKKTRG